MIVVCVTIISVVTLLAVLAAALVPGDSEKAATLTAIISSIFVTILTQLRTIFVVRSVDEKADKMLNGVMDEKIQRNLRAVLDERAPSQEE